MEIPSNPKNNKTRKTNKKITKEYKKKWLSKSKNPRPSLWKWSFLNQALEYLISEHKNLTK